MSGRTESDLCVVARFHYRHEGELAVGFLESAGINAALFMDDGGGSEAGMSFVRPGRVMVVREQRDEARAVLDTAGYGDRLEE
jgi:hypothetical protein